MTNKFKKIHLTAIQEIAVSSTAMTHTYWTAPFFVLDRIKFAVQKRILRNQAVKRSNCHENYLLISLIPMPGAPARLRGQKRKQAFPSIRFLFTH